MMPYNDYDNNDEENDYSPTAWERDPFESDEDYEERVQDQEDYVDYYND